MRRIDSLTDRQVGLDILKCICAFLVVCIHYGSATYIHGIVYSIARIAVPIFFLITGFFYASIVDKNKQLRQLLKIGKLLVFGMLLYLLVNVLYCLICKDSVSEFLFSDITLKGFVRIILFNLVPFSNGEINSGHLWYLSALLYVLLAAIVLQKFNLFKKAYCFIPVLLVGAVFLNNINMLLMGNNFTFVYQNYLLFGMPFFLLGHLINRIDYNLSHGLSLFLASICLITVVIENQALIYLGISGSREIYLGTPFAAVGVFLLFLTVYRNRKINCIERVLFNVGLKYSTGIYIIHRIIGFFLDKIAETTGFELIYGYIRPVLVFIVSLLVVWTWKNAVNRSVQVIKKMKKRDI